MDAMKFIEERNRMCDSFETCGMCPAFEFSCSELRKIQQNPTIVSIVERWSKENPRKTRQDVFLEQYPEASCVDNILVSCPKVIDKNFSCSKTCFNCAECRREFWMQEVE
jgi:hypothetical protein|nr:MAG TPA: hypothetical protein [Caudoviricetes sp.]